MRKRSIRNPSGNRLPAGIEADELRAAINKSGYPLQARVAAQLEGSFSVIEEWGYIDRESKETRSLDINAYHLLPVSPSNVYHPSLNLLIECKRSDLPFVFFESAVGRANRDYPRVVALGPRPLKLISGTGSLNVRPSEFLALHELDFVSEGPRLSRSFSRIDRVGKRLDLSGQVIYREIMLPLISALTHWEGIRNVPLSTVRAQYFPAIVLAVCVVDGPMIAVSGPPAKSVIEPSPWVRVMRQEAFSKDNKVAYRHFTVDFVHADFLETFISEHVLPFMVGTVDRMEQGKNLIETGEGRVTNWQKWSWDELISSQQR